LPSSSSASPLRIPVINVNVMTDSDKVVTRDPLRDDVIGRHAGGLSWASA
jgi:hypothetical protein